MGGSLHELEAQLQHLSPHLKAPQSLWSDFDFFFWSISNSIYTALEGMSVHRQRCEERDEGLGARLG